MLERVAGRAMPSGRTARLVIGASYVLFAASTAHAAGFASAEFAGEAGTVVSDHPSSMYFNPAAMALSEGMTLYASGVLALRHGHFTHARSMGEAPDPTDAEGANVGTAHFSNMFGAPSLAATYKVGKLAFGAATYVPFGGRIHWSRNRLFTNDAYYPLAAGGVQRWTITQGGITHLFSTAGVAAQWRWLSVGLSGNVIYSTIINTQAKSYSAVGLPDTTSEGRNRIDVSGFDASFGIGVIVEAIPHHLWFGTSYQSRPNLRGEMKLNGTLTLGYQGDVTSKPVTFTHALPDILRLGARYQLSKTIELRVFGDYTRWSVLQGQCIAMRDKPCAVTLAGLDNTPDATTIQYMARNWNDTFAVRLGLTYQLAPGVGLDTGLGYETAATPDGTLDPMLPDAQNVRMALGGHWSITPRVTGTFGVTGVYFFRRDNTGKSTLAMPELPARRADGGGVYELWLVLLNLGLQTHLF